jgi:phosphoserine phosphatase
MASALGFTPADVLAVEVRFDDNGNYAGFGDETPLVKASGKREVVEKLALPRRRLMVGDGSTDAQVRPAVDAFAAYTGVIRREGVVREANYVVASFEALERIVLS